MQVLQLDTHTEAGYFPNVYEALQYVADSEDCAVQWLTLQSDPCGGEETGMRSYHVLYPYEGRDSTDPLAWLYRTARGWVYHAIA